MMKRILFSLLVFLCSATAASADTNVRTAAQFELQETEVIDGNFLGIAHPVTVSGQVVEDAILLGNRVSVTGQVGGDVLAAGVLTTVAGVTEGDVRVMGGQVVVSGTVTGDVMALGGTVDVTSDAVIEGDILLYGGTAVVSGQVGGDVYGSVRDLSLNGPVGGRVDVTVHQLALGTTASITESVSYTSASLLTQTLDTIVGGDVVRSDPLRTVDEPSLGGVAALVLVALVALLWSLVARRSLKKVTTQAITYMPRSVMLGTLGLVTGAALVVATALAVFGLYVSFNVPTSVFYVVLFGLSLFMFLVLLAIAAVPSVLTHGVLQITSFTSQAGSTTAVLLGSLIAVMIWLVPTVGIIVLAGIAVMAFGSILDSIIRSGLQ